MVRSCGFDSDEKCTEVKIPISGAAIVTCICKGDKCNTGVHQSIGHKIIVGCVIVTAVVGHIFYY